ncbi:MAG: D-glycero-alpha-D-manno-heptose-1,7-bisphosphate 7-phosphatase [Ignavibacteria bacterium]
MFLDKDGTLIRDVPHNVDPSRIELAPGAGAALARLREAGFALVLVSNQPGVARGCFAEADLAAVWRRLGELLAPFGVGLDAIYYCPHDPAGRVRRHAIACRCRKPQPGLLKRAAAEHGFALERSWMIGDILDDVEAGNRAGCRSVLLDAGGETEWRAGPWRRPAFVARDLADAAACILSGEGRGSLTWTQA